MKFLLPVGLRPPFRRNFIQPTKIALPLFFPPSRVYFINSSNQLLIFNPLTFGAVVYILIKHRPAKGWIASSCLLAMTPKDRRDVIASEAKPSKEQTPQNVFERGLRFILLGFFFFFWLMAFRGHVEPHWTIVCVIPVVVLLYRKALIDIKLEKYIKRFILPSLLLVLVFRILLLTPLADRFGYHGKEAYYKAIETVAGDHPVVFRGSFQKPALYHYFTGKESSTLRGYYDRKTQYDLWQFDKAWVGQPVFICGPVIDLSQVYQIGDVRFEGYLMRHFQSPNRLLTDFHVINSVNTEPLVLHYGDTIRMNFTIHNPYNQTVDFQNDEMSIGLTTQYLSTDDFGYCYYDRQVVIPPHSTYNSYLFTIVSKNIDSGPNELTLGMGDGVGSFITEGSRVKVRIVE